MASPSDHCCKAVAVVGEAGRRWAQPCRIGISPAAEVSDRLPEKGFTAERHRTIASADDIARQIAALKDCLTALDRERSEVTDRLSALEQQVREAAKPPLQVTAPVTMASPTAEKIALFRSLFRGREEVFPRRWENPNSGKAGYSPVCRNEWVRGVCGKPQIKCGECPNQAFVPFGDDVLRSHLTGRAPGHSTDFTAGVYPMLPDETCWSRHFPRSYRRHSRLPRCDITTELKGGADQRCRGPATSISIEQNVAKIQHPPQNSL